MAASGWRIRVTTFDGDGRPAVFQDLLVYEPDQERALKLIRSQWATTQHQIATILAPAYSEELAGFLMRRGEVRPV